VTQSSSQSWRFSGLRGDSRFAAEQEEED